MKNVDYTPMWIINKVVDNQQKVVDKQHISGCDSVTTFAQLSLDQAN